MPSLLNLDSWVWLIAAFGLLALLIGYAAALGIALKTEAVGRRSPLPVPRHLRGRLALGLVLLSIAPPAGLSVSLSMRQLEDERAQYEAMVRSAAAMLADDIGHHVADATANVMAAAAAYESAAPVDTASGATLLARFHPLFPDFLTMLVADAGGRVIAASRNAAAGFELVESAGHDVSDRDYFRIPMRTGAPYVSEVFQGRGLGTDPIVAVSAPVRSEGVVRGIVEGSLDLRRLRAFEQRFAFARGGARLVVLDASSRVIYASPDTGLAFLDGLQDDPLVSAARRAGKDAIARGRMAAGTDRTTEWLAALAASDRSWQVLVLLREATLLGQLRAGLDVTLLWLLVTVACGLLLAEVLRRNVTLPLDWLARSLREFRIEDSRGHFAGGLAFVEEFRGLFRGMQRFAWRLRQSYGRIQRSLEDATRLRNELSDVLASREEEIRARTRELDEANKSLQRLARVDPLTGLANRRWFNDFLDLAWRVARRERNWISCILIDVDHFKEFNDRYGHQRGDDCLVRVAGVLKDAAGRPLDHAARYGGEEFVVILSDAPPEAARKLAERMRAAVESLRIPHTGSPLGVVTVSIGIRTVVPDAGVSPEQALHQADTALYAAKAAGRNQVSAHQDNVPSTLRGAGSR